MPLRVTPLVVLRLIPCLIALPPAAARADITLDAILGFGQNGNTSRYRPNDWDPLTIYLSGQGIRGNAQLQVTVNQGYQSTVYTRQVTINDGPTNTSINFVLHFQDPDLANMSGGGVTTVTAKLVRDGRQIASKVIPVPLGVQSDSYNILGLTRDASGLNFLSKKRLGLLHRGSEPANIYARAGIDTSQPLTYNVLAPVATSTLTYSLVTALPAMEQGYDMIDAVALADLPLDAMTDDQIDALKGYVRQGGLLIVSGGGDPARLKGAFFSEMLPFDGPVQFSQTADLPTLAKRYRAHIALTGPITLAAGKLRPGAEPLFGDLVIRRPYGAGMVVFTAFDYLDPVLRAWPAAPAFWRDLLLCGNNDVSPRGVLASTAQVSGDASQTLVDALAGSRATSAPGLNVVSGFLISYLILLVPVSYFVLKKLDRREMAWFTAPLLILGFSIASYVMARTIKGGALTGNRAVVLETWANSELAAGYGETSLYAPRRDAYNIGFGNPSDSTNPYRTLPPDEVLAGQSASPGAALTEDEDASPQIVGADIKLWDKRTFETPVVADLGGVVQSTVKMKTREQARVTVTNRTRYKLNGCALVAGTEVVNVGDLAPGQSASGTINWAHSGFTSGISVPPPLTQIRAATDLDAAGSSTGEEAKITAGMAQAIMSDPNSGNGFSGYQYGMQDARKYGKQANVLTGWFSDPVLPVQVNGNLVPGAEVNLLVVHLQPPADAVRNILAFDNPFAAAPVTEIENELPPGVRMPYRTGLPK